MLCKLQSRNPCRSCMHSPLVMAPLALIDLTCSAAYRAAIAAPVVASNISPLLPPP